MEVAADRGRAAPDALRDRELFHKEAVDQVQRFGGASLRVVRPRLVDRAQGAVATKREEGTSGSCASIAPPMELEVDILVACVVGDHQRPGKLHEAPHEAEEIRRSRGPVAQQFVAHITLRGDRFAQRAWSPTQLSKAATATGTGSLPMSTRTKSCASWSSRPSTASTRACRLPPLNATVRATPLGQLRHLVVRRVHQDPHLRGNRPQQGNGLDTAPDGHPEIDRRLRNKVSDRGAAMNPITIVSVINPARPSARGC